mgnify:FL=1
MSRPTCFARTEFPRAIPNISVVLRAGTSGVVVTIIGGVLFGLRVRCFAVHSSIPVDLQINKCQWKLHRWLDSFVKEIRSVSYMRVTYWIQGFTNLICCLTGAV